MATTAVSSAWFTQRQRFMRVILVVMVVAFAPFVHRIEVFYGMLPGALSDIISFRLLLKCSKGRDPEFQIAAKRFLSMLIGLFTGLPVFLDLVVNGRYDPGTICFFCGVQMGCYLGDMWFMTEAQAKIPALMIHHVVSNTTMFAFMVAQDYDMNFIALMVELTNPAWYANVLLKTYVRAGEYIMSWSRTINIYLYVVVRFVWATHECWLIASKKFLVWPPTSVGALYAVLLVVFTWMQTENIVKLIQSGQPSSASAATKSKHA